MIAKSTARIFILPTYLWKKVYYKMRQNFVTKCCGFFIKKSRSSFVTKCVNAITKRGRYNEVRRSYNKTRQVLLNASIITKPGITIITLLLFSCITSEDRTLRPLVVFKVTEKPFLFGIIFPGHFF